MWSSTIPYTLKFTDFGHFHGFGGPGGRKQDNLTFVGTRTSQNQHWPWQDLCQRQGQMLSCFGHVPTLPQLRMAWNRSQMVFEGSLWWPWTIDGRGFCQPGGQILETDTCGGHFRVSEGHFRLSNGHFTVFWGRLCQQHISDQCQNHLKTMKLTTFWPCFDLCRRGEHWWWDIVSMPISAKHGFDARWPPLETVKTCEIDTCGGHFRVSWGVSNGRRVDSMPNSAKIELKWHVDDLWWTQFRVKKGTIWHGFVWFSGCHMVDAHNSREKWKS